MTNLVLQDSSVAIFDTAQFEHMQRIATVMSSAKLVPVHLQGSVADCLMICQQAHRWQMDPFALAQATYVVHGRFGYEGKLVAAVINTRARLREKMSYDITGTGDDIKVVVSAAFEDEEEARTVEATVKEAKTQSSGNRKWNELPDQMICYYGARKWARRHAPELMLGVCSEDDIQQQEMKVINPEPVDMEKEGIVGTGETEPGTASGITDVDDKDVFIKNTRKRVKLTFRGKEIYKTAFLKKVKEMLDQIEDHDDLVALTAHVRNAVDSVEDDGDAKNIKDELEPMFDAVNDEFVTQEDDGANRTASPSPTDGANLELAME